MKNTQFWGFLRKSHLLDHHEGGIRQGSLKLLEVEEGAAVRTVRLGCGCCSSNLKFEIRWIFTLMDGSNARRCTAAWEGTAPADSVL